MLSKAALCLLNQSSVQVAITRNIGVTSVVAARVDPIQQLFVDKIREYNKKKSASKSGLIDSSPQTQKALNEELEKINKLYNAQGNNFEEFPTFKFDDVKLDSIYLEKAGK